jgi:hypothetical protein
MLTEVPDQPQTSRRGGNRTNNEQPPKMGLNEDLDSNAPGYDDQGQSQIKYVTNEENTAEPSENGLSHKSGRSKIGSVNKSKISRAQRRQGSMSQIGNTQKSGTVNLAMQILNMDEEEKM